MLVSLAHNSSCKAILKRAWSCEQALLAKHRHAIIFSLLLQHNPAEMQSNALHHLGWVWTQYSAAFARQSLAIIEQRMLCQIFSPLELQPKAGILCNYSCLLLKFRVAANSILWLECEMFTHNFIIHNIQQHLQGRALQLLSLSVSQLYLQLFVSSRASLWNSEMHAAFAFLKSTVLQRSCIDVRYYLRWTL